MAKFPRFCVIHGHFLGSEPASDDEDEMLLKAIRLSQEAEDARLKEEEELQRAINESLKSMSSTSSVDANEAEASGAVDSSQDAEPTSSRNAHKNEDVEEPESSGLVRVKHAMFGVCVLFSLSL